MDYKDKIRKLLALAKSPEPEEAKLALLKARKLMAEHKLSERDLGHEAGRKKHRECDEIEVVGVMPVISARNAGKGRLCQRIPLKERALKFVKEAIKNGRSKID